MKKLSIGIIASMVAALLALAVVSTGCTAQYMYSTGKKYNSYKLNVSVQNTDEVIKTDYTYNTDSGITAIYENISSGSYKVTVDGTDDSTTENCALLYWSCSFDADENDALVVKFDSEECKISCSTEPSVDEYTVEVLQNGKAVSKTNFERSKSSATEINAVVKKLDAGEYTYNVCCKEQKTSGTFSKAKGKDYNVNVIYNTSSKTTSAAEGTD